MSLEKRAVGTFPNYKTTEIALHELRDHGFIMDKVSVIGRDIYHYPEFTGANTSDHLVDSTNLDTKENRAEKTAKDGAIAGSTIGGFAGLLVGLGALAIPGVGPVILAGAAATAIATAVSGSVIGAATGSLAGGLVGLGIPKDRAKVYDNLIAAGHYLVIVEGEQTDISLAELVLNKQEIHDWYVYDLSDKSIQTEKPNSGVF